MTCLSPVAGWRHFYWGFCKGTGAIGHTFHQNALTLLCIFQRPCPLPVRMARDHHASMCPQVRPVYFPPGPECQLCTWLFRAYPNLSTALAISLLRLAVRITKNCSISRAFERMKSVTYQVQPGLKEGHHRPAIESLPQPP